MVRAQIGGRAAREAGGARRGRPGVMRRAAGTGGLDRRRMRRGLRVGLDSGEYVRLDGGLVLKLGRRVNLPCPDCSRLFSFLVSNFAALDLKQRATTRLQSDKESLADSQWKQGQSAGTRKKVRRGRHDADLSQTSRARAAPRAPGNSPNIHHKHTAPASLWAGPRHHVPVAERPANEPPGRKRGRGTAHAGPAAVGRRIIGQAESPMGRPAQSGLGWSPWLGRAGVVGMTSNGPLLGPLGVSSAGHV